MQYQIVQSEYDLTLESKVSEMMKEGWKCQGGISMTRTKTGWRYAQAMVKENK